MNTNLWLTIAVLGLTLVSVITRSFFLLAPERLKFSPLVSNALRYAPAMAIAAVVAPDILLLDGVVSLSVHNYALMAALMASLAYFWKQNFLMTIVVGMLVFNLLRLI